MTAPSSPVPAPAAPAAELPAANPHREAGSSLRRRFVLGIGLVSVALLGIVAWGGDATLANTLAVQSDARLVDAAHRSALLVDRVLAERERQVALIASAPTVVDGARKGGELSRSRGLPSVTIPELEERFKTTRSQQVDDRALAYLRELDSTLDIAEVIVTDRYGYNALTTKPSSDFVQSDEAWWQKAWNSGESDANATQDPATQRAVVEVARVVQGAGATGAERVGVAKAKFSLSWVDSALVQASAGSTVRVDLIDTSGKVIATSGSETRFRQLPGADRIGRATGDSAFTYTGNGTRYRAATAATSDGWRVLAQMDESAAMGPYRAARTALFIAVVIVLVGIVGALILVSRFIEQRITGPAGELAVLAESVAAGDLSQRARQTHADDEVGRLTRAVAAMIVELRRLASAMRSASHDTAAMSAEITAGSEEMAASASEIATTASDLSQQSSSMAQTIQLLAGSSDELVKLSTALTAGAHEVVSRNERLRALATENRARLDESSSSLDALTTEVQTGATAVEKLAEASAEVRTFVVLVQKLARQSKLLALNAAMEAARAGEHGEGFAVVASEVRRLSAMSSDAAERTQQIVAEVLSGIEQSRASSQRAVATVQGVRAATDHGSQSFAEIERAVAEAKEWTTSVEQTVTAASAVANDVRGRLDTLAQGTESFAAAMEQVAASSEEQSASTEEIAAAAATLAGAAERLSRIVAGLRLEAAAAGTPDADAGGPPREEIAGTPAPDQRPSIAAMAVPALTSAS